MRATFLLTALFFTLALAAPDPLEKSFRNPLGQLISRQDVRIHVLLLRIIVVYLLTGLIHAVL